MTVQTATALRVQADTLESEQMDKTDLNGWADTAAKLLRVGAAEIDRLTARDAAHVETIAVLARLLGNK